MGSNRQNPAAHSDPKWRFLFIWSGKTNPKQHLCISNGLFLVSNGVVCSFGVEKLTQNDISRKD